MIKLASLNLANLKSLVHELLYLFSMWKFIISLSQNYLNHLTTISTTSLSHHYLHHHSCVLYSTSFAHHVSWNATVYGPTTTTRHVVAGNSRLEHTKWNWCCIRAENLDDLLANVRKRKVIVAYCLQLHQETPPYLCKYSKVPCWKQAISRRSITLPTVKDS